MSDHDPNRDKGKKRAQPAGGGQSAQQNAEEQRAQRQRMMPPGVQWCTHGWCTGAPGPGPTTGFAHTDHNHPFNQDGGRPAHNHRKEQLDMRRAELQQREDQYDRHYELFHASYAKWGDKRYEREWAIRRDRQNRRANMQNMGLDGPAYSDADFTEDPQYKRYNDAEEKASRWRIAASHGHSVTRRERQMTVDDPDYANEYMAGKYDDDYVMSEAKRQNAYQDDGGGGGY